MKNIAKKSAKTAITQSHHSQPAVSAPARPDPRVVVLYHANCNDGFGAAWALWVMLGYDGVEYLPVSYGNPIPERARHATTVYIVDFSYSREELETLNREVAELIVLDHHKTAAAELDGLPFAHFDQDKSGAVLAWEHMHDLPVPELLRYVQDRDLWQWRLEDSRAINEALMGQIDRDFNMWLHLVENWAEEKKLLIHSGQIAIDVRQQQIDRLTQRPVWLEIDGHIVPAVNSPIWQSDIGEALCFHYPDTPFAAVFSIRRDGSKTYSLRSRPRVTPRRGCAGEPINEGAMQTVTHDCSRTARSFGGGGHHQAAGFVSDVGFVFHTEPVIYPKATELISSN